LQELSKAINGDSKTDPLSLFTVNILLEEMRVSYSPSMVNLTHSVNVVAKEVISIVTAIPRIRAQQFDASAAAAATGTGTEEGAAAPTAPAANAEENKFRSYYEIISDDADILRIVVQIMNGMSSTATELQKYLSYWDKYKSLWEAEKDIAIRRYAKANNSPAQFDLDITRYRIQQSEINGEASTHVINFVRIDCNAMKDALINHCLQSQNKLTNLLNSNGVQELQDIYQFFANSRDKLTQPPTNLDELSQKIGSCKDIKENLPLFLQKFEPTREIYNTLMKFEVTVKDDELTMLHTLDGSYEEFNTFIADTERLLEKSKVSMKRDLESQIDSYSHQMSELRNSSQIELPYNSENMTAQDALQIIENYKQRIQKAKEKESQLANGLAIFNMPSSEHKDLSSLIRDVDFLSQIWTVSIEWTALWDNWKNGQFQVLQVEEMENQVGTYLESWKIRQRY
jgi:dynein heavy chain